MSDDNIVHIIHILTHTSLLDHHFRRHHPRRHDSQSPWRWVCHNVGVNNPSRRLIVVFGIDIIRVPN